MSGYNVAGRTFRTQADYKAALRDQAQIEKIRAQVNTEQPGEVIRLAEDLKSGKYKFTSLVGRDFCDEINELAEKYKKEGYNAGSKIKSGRKKRRDKAKEKGKQKTGDKTEKAKEFSDYDEEMQKEIKTILRQRERRRKFLVAACAVIALGCFGYFGVYYYMSDKNSMDYEQLADLKGSSILPAQTGGVTINRTEEEDLDLTVLPEYETLYNKNKKLIGWLKIDDTNIDYPVMQTSNNEYYLDHNYNQEYDKNGSLFLDASCDIVHRNTNLIIYGHHMSSGKMFGNLNQYSSEKYYEKHSTIQFDTIYEKGTYQVMYVFRSKIYNEDEITFKYYQFFDADSEQEFDSYMQEMAALALYDTGVTASYGDELLTLSTCDYSEEDGRFVVVAKRIV